MKQDSKKKFYLNTAKIISIIPACLGLLMLTDMFLPAGENEYVAVNNKAVQIAFGDTVKCEIHAQGKYAFRLFYSKRSYHKIKIGDTLRVDVSRYFMRWKRRTDFKNGIVYDSTNSFYFAEMALLGACFFLPLLVFRLRTISGYEKIFGESEFIRTYFARFKIWVPYFLFTPWSFYYWGQVYLKLTGNIAPLGVIW